MKTNSNNRALQDGGRQAESPSGGLQPGLLAIQQPAVPFSRSRTGAAILWLRRASTERRHLDLIRTLYPRGTRSFDSDTLLSFRVNHAQAILAARKCLRATTPRPVAGL